MAFTHSKGVDYASITVDREGRQRRELTGIEELAGSIRRNGLIQPIVIDKNNKLVAGERRYTAWGLLFAEDPKQWGKIPARYTTELRSAELTIIELEENIKRHQLNWKDECIAVTRYHSAMKEEVEGWTSEDSYTNLNIAQPNFNKQLAVGKELLANNPKIHAADGWNGAYNLIKREKERRFADVMNELGDTLQEMDEDNAAKKKAPLAQGVGQPPTPADAPSNVLEVQEPPPVNLPAPPTDPIIHADFHDWVKEYTGKRFNLIHCDFPYGINHQDSDQGGADRWGSYEDTPEVYFDLCQTLTNNLDRIAYPSCHIFFWFSMTYYQWTLDHFTKAGLVVNPFPCVWHKTDNKGLLPDPNRGPRRVNETAFLMSRGDRKIVSPIANTYGAPTAKSSAIHLSEKPVPMLDHFMRMLVDDFTELLDPTCGGGSALRAAEQRGAKRVLGLERDQEFARLANAALKQDRTLRALNSKMKEG